MAKIIVRLKGGLGNQLFCYAAARRLALINNSELVIDDVTGFCRDVKYFRKYSLENFRIPCRKATSRERLEPFERLRRGIIKYISRRMPFYKRKYIEQKEMDFDERLLTLKVRGTLYLDGLWQSEGYFRDVEEVIREDLLFTPPQDSINQHFSDCINKSNSVALHIRWFDQPSECGSHNVSAEYYKRAISYLESEIGDLHFYLFSDNPVAAKSKISVSDERLTIISHNSSEDNSFADLWLMSQCKHFVIANSTFSWWGAWLATNKHKVILTPHKEISGKTSWGFKGLIPDKWIMI